VRFNIQEQKNTGGKMAVKKGLGKTNKVENIKQKNVKKDANKSNSNKVTKNMLIGDAVRIHPSVAGVMFEYGLHCIGCAVSTMETIEQGCLAHGLSGKQIDEMVEKINQQLNKK
jgi:hydroxylamine reductase